MSVFKNAAIVAISALAMGCGEDFDSQMQLSGYRVMGVQTEAPEVTPDDTVHLQVFDYYDGTEEVTYRWSLCLYSFGVLTSYECIDPELELDVGTGPTLELDLGPRGLGVRQLLDALPELPDENGEPRNLDAGFDVWVKLESGPSCQGCDTISTVKRLSLRDIDPADANANPVIEKFEVVGALERGAAVTLRVETDQPARTDGDGEEYLFTWFSSAGVPEPTRTFGDDKETELLLPNEPAEFEVAVAVRDGRGGLAVSRQVIVVR